MRPYTPPEYVSLLEVRRRAGDCWGSEANAKLRGYLRAGRLVANWPNNLAPASPISFEYWATPEGERLLSARRSELESWPVPPPVFRAADLDREIPHPWEVAKAARQARIAAQLAQTAEVKGSQGENPEKAKISSAQSALGAPYKYDWDRIWSEIALMVHEEGLPNLSDRNAEAKFRSSILNWLASRGLDVPSENSFRGKVKIFFIALRDRLQQET